MCFQQIQPTQWHSIYFWAFYLEVQICVWGIFHLLHPMNHTVSFNKKKKAVRWSWARITEYKGCELLNWLAWHQIQALLSSDFGQANGLSGS